VRVVPAGRAFAELKSRIETSKVPGMADSIGKSFADDLNLKAKGRCLVSLVHQARILCESPEAKASPLTTGLTPDQARSFQRIAWDVVEYERWSGLRDRD
jgi:hypothetical protein